MSASFLLHMSSFFLNALFRNGLTFLPAFSQSILLQSRWLLGGCKTGADGIWRDATVMDEGRQHLFMQRVLFLFEVTKRKAGRAQVLRLSQDAWDVECDIAALAGFVIDCMGKHRDENNMKVFSDETMSGLVVHFVEGFLARLSN